MSTINITIKILQFYIILSSIYLVYYIFFKRKTYETMIYKDDDIIRSINATNLLNTIENDFENYTINIEDNSYGDLSKNLLKEEKKMKDILSKKNEYINRVNNILFNHRIDVNKINHDFKNNH